MKEFTEGDQMLLKEMNSFQTLMRISTEEAWYKRTVIRFTVYPYETRIYPTKIGKPKTSRVVSWAVHMVFDRPILIDSATTNHVRFKDVPITRTRTDAKEWAEGLTALFCKEKF